MSYPETRLVPPASYAFGEEEDADDDRSVAGSSRSADAYSNRSGSRKTPGKPTALHRVLFGAGDDPDREEVPIKELEAAFKEIDVDASGVIDARELVNALRLCGLDVSQQATNAVLKEIDKNLTGDIDLAEFVDFFRHLEEMGQFQRRTEQRAKFVGFMLNLCFIISMIAVGTLLLIFIGMDEEDDEESYQLMRNVLYGSSFLLGILFLLIILVPAARFTFGVTASTVAKQVVDRHNARKARPPPVHQIELSATGGLRAAAGSSLPGVPEPLAPEAAFTKVSYRKGQQPPSRLQHQQAAAMAALPSRGHTPSTNEQGGAGTTPEQSQTLVQARLEDVEPRYSPENYRQAQTAIERGDMTSTSFNPMQVRDVHVSHEGVRPPGDAPVVVQKFPALSNSAYAA